MRVRTRAEPQNRRDFDAAVSLTVSLRTAKVFQTIDDLNGDILIQDDALGVVVAVEKVRVS